MIIFDYVNNFNFWHNSAMQKTFDKLASLFLLYSDLKAICILHLVGTLFIVRATSTPRAILAWTKYVGQILLEHTFPLKPTFTPQSQNIRKKFNSLYPTAQASSVPSRSLLCSLPHFYFPDVF